MDDNEYWRTVGDEQASYELDESDAAHQIVVLDTNMIAVLREILPHHELTNDASQTQRDK